MKKIIIPLLILCLLLCGCASVPEIDAEAILTKVVDSIDWEELQDYVKQGAEAVTEKYPALKKLADREDMQELLKDHGLDLIGKYLDSADPAVQENAQKLGAIIKILSPELTDEVDKVLTE